MALLSKEISTTKVIYMVCERLRKKKKKRWNLEEVHNLKREMNSKIKVTSIVDIMKTVQK